jgi:hypothetical protein
VKIIRTRGFTVFRSNSTMPWPLAFAGAARAHFLCLRLCGLSLRFQVARPAWPSSKTFVGK